MSIENPVRPYAFERIFALSADDAERSPKDHALQILTLQAELARHREAADATLAQARADGFTAGLGQARSETVAALLMTEQSLIAGFAKLEAGFCAIETRVAKAAAEVALTAADLLAARALTADPCLAIDAAIGRVLTQIGFRETLHVHVHSSLAEPLQVLIENRGSLLQRPLSIVLHPEPTLPPGDAHILWDEGGLSLDAAARHSAVREALGLAGSVG